MAFHYINATGSHTFDTDLGTEAVRLGSISSGLVQRAELGLAGSGVLPVDDPEGALDLLGLQYLRVTEDLAPGDRDVVWYGYIGDQSVERGDSSRASLRTGADRLWTLSLNDFNSILTMRQILSGKRPAESASARLHWLLGLSYCPVADYGYVVYPTHAMDACDYTDQTFRDVLADIVAPAALNYWADWDQPHAGIGLWLLDPGGDTWSALARISNVLSDVDGELPVYRPLYGNARLVRSPSRIASGVSLRFSGGRVYLTNPAVLDTYAYFDHSAPMANVKTTAAAVVLASTFLGQSTKQDDRITTTVRVPAAQVNNIRAGQWIDARFSHLPGYGSYVACRVMSRGVLQDEETDQLYKLVLELTPQAVT